MELKNNIVENSSILTWKNKLVELYNDSLNT